MLLLLLTIIVNTWYIIPPTPAQHRHGETARRFFYILLWSRTRTR